MTGTTTCGGALVRLLEDYGVETVFGIPGVHTLALYAALTRSPIRHIQVRHEQGAGFMADGYARASGRPGVCFLISGPGVTNALTAMGQAFADSVPMLVISSDTASESQGKGRGCLHEVTDLVAATRPLTAFSARVDDPAELPGLLARAFGLFASGRPRPVHIAVPIDVLEREVNEPWRPVTPPEKPVPATDLVARAASMLDDSRTPVIIAGGGAIHAAAALTRIAESIDAPVITSIRGKGILPDSHPLALGGAICRPEGRELLADADVVLAIGTELAETDSFVERLEIPGQLIRVDIDRAKVYDRYAAGIGIVADADAAAAAIAAQVRPRPAGNAAGRVRQVRAHMRTHLSPLESRHAIFLDALRVALSSPTMIFGDMCQVVYSGGFLFDVETPDRWHFPGGYCTLGCAVPNAIGARLAAPETPVVAVCGDGGFLFTCQELSVAAAHALPLPVIVWDNHGLGQIRDDMTSRGQQPIAVEAARVNLRALAPALGARLFEVDGPGSLADALHRALGANGPSMLIIDENASWLEGPVADPRSG